MATSQAEVSNEIRHTVREMVEQGSSNEEIYQHIAEQYGEGQIAVPRTGWNVPMSFGVPYLMLVFSGFVVLWWGRSWVLKGERELTDRAASSELDEEDEERLDRIQRAAGDSPTRE